MAGIPLAALWSPSSSPSIRSFGCGLIETSIIKNQINFQDNQLVNYFFLFEAPPVDLSLCVFLYPQVPLLSSQNRQETELPWIQN